LPYPNYSSNNSASKSPYLLRTPRSASVSPCSTKSPSAKYNSSYIPKSASSNSPFIQKKSCLKHRSCSIPTTPVNKNNKPVGINTINIQPNISTMEIENNSDISGTSSYFSLNRTTRYMDDFMLNDNDPENPKNWNVDEVSNWLYKIGYISASKYFKEKNVNGEMLVKMNLPTLREIGVSTLSERITLLHSILSLKEEYSSKCFEEMVYNGNTTSDSFSSPTKESTLEANSYQMEMNNIYEKALKYPDLDDEKKNKIKKMISTFTVSDYLTDSPNYDQEYLQLQNQLLKNQQLQNRQYGRDQLTLSQFNNVYNVTPQQYTMSDQYRRNVSIINSKSSKNENDPSLKFNHNKSLMLSAKKLVKGKKNVNGCRFEQNQNQNKKEGDAMINPFYPLNNSANCSSLNRKYQDNSNQSTNINNEKIKEKKNENLMINNDTKYYQQEAISPKVKDKKHKYLNQYHDFNLATRQGWLHVKYGTFKIWKKRWAILVYDTLYLLKDQYINSEKESRIVLVLQITSNNQIDSDKQDSKKFNFKIKDPKLGTLHFAADTQLSMITWVNLFVRIITSNPIRQIQLYPLRDRSLCNTNSLMLNSNINSVEIGDHFQININEKYNHIQNQNQNQNKEFNINDKINMNKTIHGMFNNELIEENNIGNLKEVKAPQEQLSSLQYDLNNISNVGNNNNTYINSSLQPINSSNSLSSEQSKILVEQQLQQQFKHILQQQQQQQQQYCNNMNKRNTDHQNLTINTNFNSDGTLKKNKNKSPGLHNTNMIYNNNRSLNINTNIFSGEQTLLSGETTSARNTIFNKNDIFISPENISNISNGLNIRNNKQSNMLIPTNYTDIHRMSIYTPVSYSNESPQYYCNSLYGQESNYNYTSSNNNEQKSNIGRLSDITIDPYLELHKYNYLSSIPRSAESISESFISNIYQNSSNTDNYLPSQSSKIKSYAQ